MKLKIEHDKNSTFLPEILSILGIILSLVNVATFMLSSNDTKYPCWSIIIVFISIVVFVGVAVSLLFQKHREKKAYFEIELKDIDVTNIEIIKLGNIEIVANKKKDTSDETKEDVL